MIMDAASHLFCHLMRRNIYVAWSCNVPEGFETKIKPSSVWHRLCAQHAIKMQGSYSSWEWRIVEYIGPGVDALLYLCTEKWIYLRMNVMRIRFERFVFSVHSLLLKCSSLAVRRFPHLVSGVSFCQNHHAVTVHDFYKDRVVKIEPYKLFFAF